MRCDKGGKTSEKNGEKVYERERERDVLPPSRDLSRSRKKVPPRMRLDRGTGMSV